MSATIYSNSQFTDSPYGLKLQRTITATGTTSITDIPAGIQRVYAIVIGGGGAGSSTASTGQGGGAGGYSAGWTYVSNSVTVGTGGTGTNTAANGAQGNPSIYGMIFAGGGSGATNNNFGGFLSIMGLIIYSNGRKN